MSALETPINSFLSISAVRAAHRELQKLHRAEGNHPVVLEQIKGFIQRAKATGVFLESETDQAAVQSLIDMWASVLYKAGYDVPDPTLLSYDPSLAPTLDESSVPYIGLESFSEQSKEFFSGVKRWLPG